MGREVRRVPQNWEHPKRDDGSYIPLDQGFCRDKQRWDTEKTMWAQGKRRRFVPLNEPPESLTDIWEDKKGDGPAPDIASYMPDWDVSICTHYQMYEDVSEGTPISPVCATPEELARWLADNNASAFADCTATYEQWLRVCQGGSAPSMVIADGQVFSGVAWVGSQEE